MVTLTMDVEYNHDHVAKLIQPSPVLSHSQNSGHAARKTLVMSPEQLTAEAKKAEDAS